MKRGTLYFFVGKRTVFLLLLFCSVFSLRAQGPDSLDILIKNYEYDRALALIDSLEEQEGAGSYISEKASLYKGLNRFDKAAELYLELFLADSTQLAVMNELAACYFSMADMRSAQEYYAKALAYSPGNVYTLQKLGDAFFQDDNYESALKSYDGAMEQDSSYYLLKQCGRCCESLELVDSAIALYRQALAATRIDMQTSYRLANLYKDKKNYDSALQVTQAYIDIDSSNLRMMKMHAYLCFLDKRYENAVSAFERCRQLNDISDFTHRYLGFSYYKLEDYEQARTYLQKAFLVDSTNAELSYILGLACTKYVYVKEGLGYLDQTIGLLRPDPAFISQVYQDKAAAHSKLGWKEEAKDDYLLALSWMPGDTLLLFRIASYFDHQLNDQEKALEYYTRFMETRPEDTRLAEDREGGNRASYYSAAERRIEKIREEQFWERDPDKD